jgi:hypothetical protein
VNELEEGELEEGEINQHNDNEIYDSVSSEEEEDTDRLEKEMKKREDFWKTMNQLKPDIPKNSENLLEMALEAAFKTNKKMLMLRKKVMNI